MFETRSPSQELSAQPEVSDDLVLEAWDARAKVLQKYNDLTCQVDRMEHSTTVPSQSSSISASEPVDPAIVDAMCDKDKDFPQMEKNYNAHMETCYSRLLIELKFELPVDEGKDGEDTEPQSKQAVPKDFFGGYKLSISTGIFGCDDGHYKTRFFCLTCLFDEVLPFLRRLQEMTTGLYLTHLHHKHEYNFLACLRPHTCDCIKKPAKDTACQKHCSETCILELPEKFSGTTAKSLQAKSLVRIKEFLINTGHHQSPVMFAVYQC
ncbi:hypothetical protein C8J56DRAFT_883788 [Mycena floridula]|nr:hypothetical protein C8J56DRAFT_883788 [Mycena floridula]